MKAHKFEWFRQFLERRSGIVINDAKAYLVQSRIKPLLSKYGMADINAFILAIKNHENSDMAIEAIEVMTTNETLFFRDQYPYEALEEVIFPELQREKGLSSPIRIWSAASSRGQEAYSIAMTASKAVPGASQRVKIIGTDLSAESVTYANKGVYSAIEVKRGAPAEYLTRYFEPVGADWKVHRLLKSMVQFREGNLVDDKLVTQMHSFGAFDVVFLRNVLIYFSGDERKRVIDRVAKTMNRGGYLITGAADLVSGNQSRWESVLFKGKRLWRLV